MAGCSNSEDRQPIRTHLVPDSARSGTIRPQARARRRDSSARRLGVRSLSRDGRAGATRVLPRVTDLLSGIPESEVQGRALVTVARAQALPGIDPGATAHGGVDALAVDTRWPTPSVGRRVQWLHAGLTASAPNADGVAGLGWTLGGVAV